MASVDVSAWSCGSPVSGCVRSLFVEPDDFVEKDTVIAVIESMKTELSVRATCSGRVTNVGVSQGQLVKAGDFITEITPSNGGIVQASTTKRTAGAAPAAGAFSFKDSVEVAKQVLKRFENNGDLLLLPVHQELAQLLRSIASKEKKSSLRRTQSLLQPRWRSGTLFRKILIANRGEIAVRIMKTCRQLGIATVAIYSDPDAESEHVRMADESFSLGANAAADTYLNSALILQIAMLTGADALHPGYGFLSENADFAQECEQKGIAFIGPTADMMRAFGLKHEARDIAERAGVRVLRGSPIVEDVNEAEDMADKIGYPLLVKAAAGGGGIGIQLVKQPDQLTAAIFSTRALAERYFNDGRVFLEKYIARARHIEVQVFGDGNGEAIQLGERECSIQRRHQKVVEETPACIDETLREKLHAAAVRLARAGCYRNAGTVEFLVDADTNEFYFIEMNTRLQVEHGVTELVHRVDLVEMMIKQRCGLLDSLAPFATAAEGHAIQVRVYAEDPLNNYSPSLGKVTRFKLPQWEWVRYDSTIEEGSTVTPYYDPMCLKVICFGDTRSDATLRVQNVLDAMDVKGIVTNVVLLKQIVKSQAFADGHLTTGFLDVLPTQTVLEIVEGGMQTTVQDFPGRVGLWNVGVPPSGPMDNYAHRLANRLVGNDSSAAALEITTLGPVIRFHSDAFIALTGAPATAVLKTNNAPVPFWRAVSVAKGDELRIAELKDGGCRCYLAVRGGFDLPLYLGSRSTFPRGAVGPMPRALEAGDLLAVAPEPATGVEQIHSNILVPRYGSEWTVRVLPGPHEAPDFFTEGDVEKFYATEWKVHYNSNRLGIRLDGPTDWQWARTDGGEGGSHPSNVHDCVYAIGSINFTGDKPVIITQDGPSLGGFVCIATVITADMWMLGQLTPGDTLRFVRVALPQAIKVWRRQDLEISSLDSFAANADSTEAGQELAMREPSFERAVVARLDGSDSRPSVVYRMAGDCYVLIEYGDMVLDFASRFRVHALQLALEAAGIDGLLECSPGVRSLQIKYDGLRLPLSRLLSILAAVETSLVSIESVTTRVLHLPLAFDDRWCKEAVAKYMASIRSSGPWLPSNVDFVARCNGVSERDVRESVLGTDFMVLGLGDVYLGAPCAVAMDPLKRMVVPKYNPARTYTPEGAVGLGGAYMCIYPMASPGGYQLVGRTLPIWNGLQTTADFVNSPWLLRNFDRVRFHLVSEEDLKTARHAFKRGTYEMRVTEEDFSLRKYQELLDSNSDAIAAFNRSQTKAAKLATIGY